MAQFNQVQKTKQSAAGWPWKNIAGFMLCIILTAFSLGGLLYSSYQPKYILILLTVFAFGQAMIQLFRLQSND